MNITQGLIDKVYKEYRKKYEGKKEDYFAPLFISKMHDKPLDTVFVNCIFGNHDYGIDGYFLDKEARNLYLYQFKWSNNYELFKESYTRLIDHGLERIFGDPKQDSQTNQSINSLKYTIDEYGELINKVYIRFVFNGELEKAQQSRSLENLREDLESKKYLIDEHFGNRSIFFIIEYLSNDTETVVQASKTRKTHKYEIDFKGQREIIAANGERLYLGFVTMNDLGIMFEEMNLRLFEKNIRAGLNDDLPPNRAIKKSLKSILIDQDLSPEYFTFNHNGITLYAEEIDLSGEAAIIVEPRVLNGAQTITTFAKFIKDHREHKALNFNGRVKDIKVIAKLLTHCNNEFITNVTIANNRQNPVDPINLRATDQVQFEFEDKFREELSIFYERQEKAFESLSDSEREDMGIYDLKEISIKKLAQTFLALQGEIDKMSRLPEVFENDVHYKNTFLTNYLKVSASQIVLIYKIHYRVNSVIREILEKGSNKYWWISKAKNIIWALLIQGILNDDDLDDLMNDHGQDLSVASNYVEYLKNIGSKKIRFILSDLVQQKKYAELVEQEKYSFFRTKVAYQEAMQLAKRKYGWEKKTLGR